MKSLARRPAAVLALLGIVVTGCSAQTHTVLRTVVRTVTVTPVAPASTSASTPEAPQSGEPSFVGTDPHGPACMSIPLAELTQVTGHAVVAVKGGRNPLLAHRDQCAWEFTPTSDCACVAVSLQIDASESPGSYAALEKYQAGLVRQHTEKRIPGMRNAFVEGSSAGLWGNTTWFARGVVATLTVRLSYLWTAQDNVAAVRLTRFVAPHIRRV